MGESSIRGGQRRMWSRTALRSLIPARVEDMAEANPPPLPQFGPEGQARMSLPARLLNVFAVPGQVFTDVRSAPVAVSNWLVPTMLAALVGLASVLTILSDPAIQKQFLAKQKQVIDEGVKAGRLTDRDKQT